MGVRLLVLGASALPLALILPNAAWATASPPVIQSFTVTPVNSNYGAMSTSPLVLYKAGGYVNVSGQDSGGGNGCKATITSKPRLSGLPVKAPCGTPLFATVDIPANSGRKSGSYKFTMRAQKPTTVKAAPIIVTVGTTPTPSQVPGIIPGSTWEATGATCPSPPSPLEELIGWPPSSIEETFNADGTISGSYPGSYSVEGNQLGENLLVYQGSQTMFKPVYVEFAFTWNPSSQDYTGTDGYGCSWTLMPEGS
jgi:hypothetical protein